ncbi:MAG: hypothetical protein ACE5G0_22645, partial [Rhodothermales bacterium]
MKILVLIPVLAVSALLGPVAVAQTLSVSNNGRLYVNNGGGVDLGSATTLVEQSGGLVTGGTGTITASRDLDFPNGINVAGLGVEITASANLRTTTVTRGHDVQRSGGHQGIARYYDINPTISTGLNATLVFHYDESELGGVIEVDLRLFRSTDGGQSWTQMGGVPDPTGNTVTLTGIDAFSRWTLAGDGLLPVELIAFEAQVDGSDVLLRWNTASETNNAGFEVQWREGGSEKGDEEMWDVVAFVDGHGTTEVPQQYTYRLKALDPGRHVFRLQQIDYDGTFAYSPEVEVFVELPEAYLLTPPYPNPFTLAAQFRLMIKRRQVVEVMVYDLMGRQVRALYRGVMEAEQARLFAFEAGDLP